MKKTGYKIGIAVLWLALATPTAHAEAQPLSPLRLSGRYDLAWSGITLGRVRVQVMEDDTSYRFQIDTKTKGIGAIMSDEKSLITTEGRKNAAGDYLPSRYEFRPQKKGDDDLITLTYDDDGKLIQRVRVKDDDPRWRPPVPLDEASTAHDPLTVVFILRHLLHGAVAANQHEVSTRAYDGMRLFTMRVIRDGSGSIKIMDQKREVMLVDVKREPINGYTPKELKKYEKGDPAIRFYFTDDAELLPIAATAAIGFGTLSLTLVERD